MKIHPLLASVVTGVVLAAFLVACGTPQPMAGGSTSAAKTGSNQIARGQLYGLVNVRKIYIRSGTYGRKVRRAMKPRYITVHSTQNYSGDAG